MPKVVIVNGSPNQHSRLTGLVQHVQQQLIDQGVFGGIIHVASLPADDLVQAKFESKEIQLANALVASADAVVFASPVYKASYSGLLKTYLDLLPQNALAGKRITPVFIGGTIAHLLAVDFAFKPVASVLGARHFTSLVYAVDTQVTRIDVNGEAGYELDSELISRLNQALAELIHELGEKVNA